MNRPGSKWKRASLLVMALCITVSLPLSALAEEPGADAPEGAVYTAVQVGPGEFLARVFRATDAGRPLDGTTRAQYVTIIYNAAGAPEVSGRPTFPDVEEDADYADALAWAEQAGVISAADGAPFDPEGYITGGDALDMLCRAAAAVGGAARDIANGVLASYTGRCRDEDYVLAPADILAVLDRITREDGSAAPCLRSVESAAGDTPFLV